MDVEEEEVWFWLRILFYFDTAMLEFIHPCDMPYTEKQQSLFYPIRGREMLGTILLHCTANNLGFQHRSEAYPLESTTIPQKKRFFHTDREFNGKTLKDILPV